MINNNKGTLGDFAVPGVLRYASAFCFPHYHAAAMWFLRFTHAFPDDQYACTRWNME